MKYLPLLAALALFGCADDPAAVETPVEPPAEVVTEPTDDLEEEILDESDMIEGEVVDGDEAATEAPVVEDGDAPADDL